MTATDFVFIAVALVIIVALIIATIRLTGKRRQLRNRFGPEYHRAVSELGSSSAAEAELQQRLRRHQTLRLRQLSPEVKAQLQAHWTDIEQAFIDEPDTAVRNADQLLSAVVAARGYPVVEYGERLSHLSVEHAGGLNAYRAGHDTVVRSEVGRATTEELRRAMVAYREMLSELVGAQVSEQLPTHNQPQGGPAGYTNGQPPQRYGRPGYGGNPASNGHLTGRGRDDTEVLPVTPHDPAAAEPVSPQRSTGEPR